MAKDTPRESISTIAGKFANLVELQEYCNKQYVMFVKAQDKIRQLEVENEHLKKIIADSQQIVDVPETDLLIKNTEQIICEMEIEKLKKVSMERSLTLEETKRFDLLVKNLILAKGTNKDIKPDYTKLPNGYTEGSLIELVFNKDPVEKV